MKELIRCGHVYLDGVFKPSDVVVNDGVVSGVLPFLSAEASLFDIVYDFSKFHIFPGFADVHVHLREPGFSYKETIRAGSLAAAAGGFTAVCSMPNLSPAPDSPDNIMRQLDIIRRDALIEVYPYATLTLGREGYEPADFGSLGAYTKMFSDDGSGIQSEALMTEIMHRVKQAGGIIAAHCEDNALIRRGYIHDGEYAALHRHRGICSESEWGQIKRDLVLAKKTGCPYHVCHVSTKESVELIRRAKAEGADISCETAPHYFVFNDMDLQEDGRFKMNPPIRAEADRQAIIKGLADGTIDCLATDHAPHSAEEKSKGLARSAMGIVGLETAFSAAYSYLVRPGIIPLEKLIDLMSSHPRERFCLRPAGLSVGERADFTVAALDEEYTVDSAQFLSLGRSSPFDGMRLFGKIEMTYMDGRVVWQSNSTEN